MASHGILSQRTDADDDLATDQSPPRKRARVKLACLACRERKTRCDGRQPVCEACEARGVGHLCKYMYILEQKAARRSPRYEVGRASTAPSASRSQENTVYEAAQLPPALRNQVTSLKSRDNVAPMDALGTVPSYTGVDELYGSSSSVKFTRRSFPDTGLPGSSSMGARSKPLDVHRYPDRLWERNESDAMLPRRRVADEYLRSYWDFLHPVFPIVHRPTVMRQYEALWTSNQEIETRSDRSLETEEITFLAIINLLFALGSKLSDSVAPPRRTEVADGFYQKSRRVYIFDILDSTSLEAVQLLLLAGVYLQSSDHAERCWNVVGLAIRTAQSFGLHTEANLPMLPSPAVLEMRRRIWHNCVSLDRSDTSLATPTFPFDVHYEIGPADFIRLLSMTFGRPMMVGPDLTVPLPSMVDDEFLDGPATYFETPNTLPQMSLFVCSCRLFEILHDILSVFYVKEIGTSKQGPLLLTSTEVDDCIINVLKFNKRIDLLEAEVPHQLKGLGAGRTTLEARHSAIYLQQQVYYCRCVGEKVLLQMELTSSLAQDPLREVAFTSTSAPAKRSG